jgi:hypothetical protein
MGVLHIQLLCAALSEMAASHLQTVIDWSSGIVGTFTRFVYAAAVKAAVKFRVLLTQLTMKSRRD